ncbi:uncharacterized protein V1510DRAFT_438414, partial [Dipodascopsis tothii]|uniref:uncharacterized protein n=1 Tax=Dipodascopsis tothii TaxID=44089 RepID=UPI0034D01B54
VLPEEIYEELSSLQHLALQRECTYSAFYGYWTISGVHIGLTETPVQARISLEAKSLRLEQEYMIMRQMQRLDPACSKFIRAFDFIRLRKSKAVMSVFERLADNSLSSYGADQPITVPQFLDFAIGTCECLELFHQSQNSVYGEIMADTFYFNAETRAVKILRFGCSAKNMENLLTNALESFRLDECDESSAAYLTTLAGRMIYLSPEQTGRTAFGLNYRSDLYSLGILFYTLLASHPPYVGSPMELLHHILHTPLPPLELDRPDVSAALNEIIKKMTMKPPDLRFKSATGIKNDLVALRNIINAGEDSAVDVEAFQIGQHDVSPVFVFPNQILDREQDFVDVTQIIRRFHARHAAETQATYAVSRAGTVSSASTGPAELLVPDGSGQALSDRSQPSLSTAKTPDTVERERPKPRIDIVSISGYSGIGKTSFVCSLQPEIRKYGYFASAKFTAKKSYAHEILIGAITAILRQILTEPEDVLKMVHRKLRAYLGRQRQNVPLIKQFFPLLETFLGRATKGLVLDVIEEAAAPAPPDVKIPVNKMQASAVIVSMLQTLCEMFTLVLCFEDLHLADEEAAEAVLSLVGANVDMVVLLTHTDAASVPRNFRAFLDQDPPRLTHVRLKPLSKARQAELVAATLHRDQDDIRELTDFLFEKLHGNHFYLKEFMTALDARKAIRFDWRVSLWVHDPIDRLDEIYQTFAKDTVLDQDFIIRRLSDLPAGTRSFLKWAAFMGNVFSFKVVQRLAAEDDPENEVVSALQAALTAGLVTSADNSDTFEFSHDKYLAAAVCLAAPEAVAGMHLRIVRVLLETCADQDDVLAICEHLCKAAALLRALPARQQYRRVLARGARRIIETGSYSKALEYYTAAIELLQDDRWNPAAADVAVAETFELFCHCAEVEFWHGNLGRAKALLAELTAHCESQTQTLTCFLLRNKIRFFEGTHAAVCASVDEALVAVGFGHLLSHGDAAFDHAFWGFHARIEATPDDVLLAPVPAKDRTVVLLKSLLSHGVVAAYLGAPQHLFRLSLALFQLDFNHGADDSIAVSYIFLGMIAISRYKQYAFADKLRRLSYTLLGKSANPSTIAQGYVYYYFFLDHFANHLSAALDKYAHALSNAVSVGDKLCVSMLESQMVAIKFLLGEKLSAVLELCDDTQLTDGSDWATALTAIVQVSKAFQGRTRVTEPDHIISDDTHDSAAFMAAFFESDQPRLSGYTYCSFYVMALYFYGFYDHVLAVAARIHMNVDSLKCSRGLRWYNCIVALAQLKVVRRDRPTGAAREAVLSAVRHTQADVRERMTLSDVNLYMYWALVDMELEDVEGHLDRAIVRHESLLEHHARHGYRIEKALGSWLCAEIYLRHGVRSVGRHLLQSALQDFAAWGAVGLVEHVRRTHAALLAGDAEAHTRSVGVQTSTHPDDYDDRPRYDDGASQTSEPAEPVDLGLDLGRDWVEPPLDVPQHSATLDIIDLTSVIESSQMIASEINVDTLLRKMIEIFLNTTRAETSAVVVQEDGTYRVAAYGDLDHIEYYHGPDKAIDALADTLLVGSIAYVLRTGETVFMADTTQDARFAGAGLGWLDRFPGGRSVLVLPVRHKNVSVGAIYLEGPPNSFNTRNLEVISLLGQQMGISITNALLFKNIRKVTSANAKMIEIQNSALQSARESEARFLATLETMPCIIWTARHDRGGELDYLNEYWYKFCGMPTAGAKNTQYFAQIHPDDRAAVQASLDTRLATGEFPTVEMRLRDAAGNYRWHINRSTPLRSEDGTITKWIGALVDIDDQRRAREDALKAMRLKEEASRMKSEFLANMSHEIRTPIAGVIGMIDLLRETELTAQQQEFVANIRLCADALLSVISDVLDFSKIEVGKLELSLVPFSPTQTLKDTLSILSFLASKKSLEIQDRVAIPPARLVLGDPGRFRQVATNLMSNAVKFTQRGCIAMTADEIAETAETVTMRVTVRDTGIGIHPAVLPKLFLPFEQGDNSTARRFGGTGLGLSITKDLVELMGGTIGLESVIGEGTAVTFTIAFPKAPADAEAVADGSAPGQWSSLAAVPVAMATPRLIHPPPRRAGDVLILVVEDNMINQKIAMSVLKRLRYRARAVDNGAEALVALDQAVDADEPYDLVLMDCQMPLIDGYEASRRLRRHPDPRISKMPVIAMTANAVTGDKELCLAAGMSDYLSKPVKSGTLEAMIRRWLQI